MKSANEVMGLGIKAARGAGFDIGQAADFGAALVIHLCEGRNTAEITAALADPDGPITGMPARIDALYDPNESGQDLFTGLALSYFQASQGARPKPRLLLPKSLEAELTTLAAKTYVPASDGSRLAGAGASLLDND
ncbi:hypothetical protein L1065_09405 [Nereida sp. MMG024]|nr:hypothetical protein [Nereida sp. MMG025]